MRRAITIIEVLIGSVLFVVLIGMVMLAMNTLGKQSSHAFEGITQTQDALMLLESIRLELSSMVMNPFHDPKEHEGNSFLISRPYGTSIQFVTERRDKGKRERFLVYYEAKNDTGETPREGLILSKKVWEFKKPGTWSEAVQAGWPKDWVGKQVESVEARYRNLNVLDLRWFYLVPDENEGKVFFRVKLTLRGQGSRLVPLTTLVGVATPDLPATISDCPCLFAPGFDAAKRDCNFCVIQSPATPEPDGGDGGDE